MQDYRTPPPSPPAAKPKMRGRLMCFLKGTPRWFKLIVLSCAAAIAILTVVGFASYVFRGQFDPTKIFPLLFGLGV